MDAETAVGAVVGGTAGGGLITVLVREFIRDRRAHRAVAAQQTAILAEMKAALVCLPTLQAALVAVQVAVEALHDRFEERTRWMIRERRPTPLDGPAPDPIDPELTPAPGLRAARERTRTPPGGVGALRGRYHHRGDRGGGPDR